MSKNAGKISNCSICCEVKVIEIEVSSGSEKVILYCKDCFDEIKCCSCELCRQNVDLPMYRDHLIENHTKEHLADLISWRMIDSSLKMKTSLPAIEVHDSS